MIVNDLKLRRADKLDSKDIFLWRNDAETRKMSRNQSVVLREQHDAWFAATLLNEERILYIAETDIEGVAEKVAMVRFDLDKTNASAEISINFNPVFRGFRLSGDVINIGIKAILTVWVDINDVVAEIKIENKPSIKTFLNCGFEEKEEHTDRDLKVFRKRVS
ncbi:GNAT family N-acetyltransferase [Phaeovulum veldkampii]|uniref:N-acetyltransferase domain-containing protein n=1 Tax=Phaeovulum veldkampii DSM 11550 TaxID=1185920 RepID=A0A2T4J955_9RHOB|nr:GNAT family protein [Phaeovulum veldkampii]PTE14446.1 hypothetical protein C5F46_14810 [Phaeovulum veldkampii DSM 11550]